MKIVLEIPDEDFDQNMADAVKGLAPTTTFPNDPTPTPSNEDRVKDELLRYLSSLIQNGARNEALVVVQQAETAAIARTDKIEASISASEVALGK